MFIKSKVATGVLVALAGAVAITSQPVMAQGQTVEITGSRIKRADAEGALPVTTFSREEIQATGAATVTEFLRTVTFASDGSYKSSSGGSWQGASAVDLRGLGAQRTLVLVDGRRLPKAPQSGSFADMNSVPLAAVERVEILTDGASAIYGSDAIGGVINIILRKDFQGLALATEMADPYIKGGDRKASSAVFGVASDKGRIVGGVSQTKRGIVYIRDFPAEFGGYENYPSLNGNNVWTPLATATPGVYAPNKYLGQIGKCDAPGFYKGFGYCLYDANSLMSDDTSVNVDSVFVRGDIQLTPGWTGYFSGSSTSSSSFGRFAPVPTSFADGNVGILLRKDSPNNTWGQDVYIRHRFAAVGTRDTTNDTNLQDALFGVQGKVASFDVDIGGRQTTQKFNSIGRNYVLADVAKRVVNDGTYNLADPFATPSSVIDSLRANATRDGQSQVIELYANAQTDLFKAPGGNARLFVGAESREEKFSDNYDAISSAKGIVGSAGNSAGGSRKVQTAAAELLVPLAKRFEASFAGRYEQYSDYGNDFAPKLSLRFQPASNVTLRASAGQGFAAPTLDIITMKPSFSAQSVVDVRNCLAEGSTAPNLCSRTPLQINSTVIANPNLKSEQSDQFSFGAVWDVTPSLSVKADYWDTKIDNLIASISAQSIVNRDNGASARPIPTGLSITRDPATGRIIQIISGYANEGNLQMSGVDASVVYSHKFAGFGNFRHELIWSHRMTAKINGSSYNGEWGSPEDRVTLSNRWSQGDFDGALNVNVIGKHGDVSEFTTADLQVGYRPSAMKRLRLVAGAINLTNQFPARDYYDGKDYNQYLYDVYGRQVYVRAELKY